MMHCQPWTSMYTLRMCLACPCLRRSLTGASGTMESAA